MKKNILPFSHPIHTTLTLPGSKSITNRALLLAALAEGESVLSGVLFSDDTEVCLRALALLGVGCEIDRARAVVRVQGGAGRFAVNQATIHCGDAGTVARFLLAVAAAVPGDYQFVASKRMMERPLGPLVSVLRAQGAELNDATGAPTLRMPLSLRTRGLAGGAVAVDIRDSSQFLSGLLLAAPLAKTPMVLSAAQLSTKSYVQMTVRMMADFGVVVSRDSDDQLSVPLACYQACHYAIEPDASTASYFFALAALTKGSVTVAGLPRHGLQGDTQFLTVLERMGCAVMETNGTILVEPEGAGFHLPLGGGGRRYCGGRGVSSERTQDKGYQDLPLSRHTACVDLSHKGRGEERTRITVSCTQGLRGVTVDMRGFSDTFMTVAALAVFAEGPTHLTGLRHTRLQESDRVAAMAEGLARLGVRTQTTEDSLTIYPGTPRGAEVSSYNDHRIAMSLALIGLRVPGVVIDGAECVAKTCPDYFERMESLRNNPAQSAG